MSLAGLVQADGRSNRHGGQDSCTVGQEKDVNWVQDYVTERTSWMADGLAELKAAEAVLKEWTQSQEN
jgi:hypothetical protein